MTRSQSDPKPPVPPTPVPQPGSTTNSGQHDPRTDTVSTGAPEPA